MKDYVIVVVKSTAHTQFPLFLLKGSLEQFRILQGNPELTMDLPGLKKRLLLTALQISQTVDQLMASVSMYFVQPADDSMRQQLRAIVEAASAEEQRKFVIDLEEG